MRRCTACSSANRPWRRVEPAPVLSALSQRWYTDLSPPIWTRLLAGAYGGLVRWHRALYRRGLAKPVRLPVPVVVVGNIVAGGAGKTPLVIALVEGLRARGFRPGIVSRGYGGSARSPRLLGPESAPAEDGDEPYMIRMRTGAPVAVGAARSAAARLLLGRGVDVIVSDDGLQHHALARKIEICVIDGVRRFGNGRLLPAGPLREPATRLQEVDFVVCNGGDPAPGEIPMQLSLCDAEALQESGRRLPLAAFAGRRVHAVAGIGNPDRFFDALAERDIDVVKHPFPDHHRYTADDLDTGDDLPVLMTEKDAVKCRGFARRDLWSVPVASRLPEAFFDAVAARLARSS
jgi:tetraacyldisaccharide 4'-kinase